MQCHRQIFFEVDTHTLTQLTDEEGPQRGLLMVVLDVHIDDVHRLQCLLLSGAEVCGVGQSGTRPSFSLGLRSHCRFESCNKNAKLAVVRLGVSVERQKHVYNQHWG